MRIEKQREQELARRKGFATRTIIQIIWLFITGAAAYFILQYFLDEGVLTYSAFYNQLGIPGWVPQWAILASLVLLTMVVMQIFLIFGYTIASPRGRAKTGKATLYSRNPDPLDNDYRH